MYCVCDDGGAEMLVLPHEKSLPYPAIALMSWYTPAEVCLNPK